MRLSKIALMTATSLVSLAENWVQPMAPGKSSKASKMGSHAHQSHEWELKQQAMSELRESPYRYINLVLFILASLCNSVAANAFTAIGPATSELYGISELLVNMNNMLYSIMFPFVVFPSNFIIEKYGLKVGSLFGEMFLILGLLIRLLFNINFYFMIAGTFVTGLGFTFMLNSPNKFAITWFPIRQIALVNSLCIFCIFTSDSIGAFTSAIFLSKDSSRDDYWNFFAVQSSIIITILLMMAILFRGSPQHPPNFSSVAKRNSYAVSFKAMVRNANYWKLFLSMTCVFGTINIFFAGISWIFKPFGYQGIEAGILLLAANLGGCIGCLTTSLILGAKHYRRNCLIYILSAILSLLALWLGLQLRLIWLVYLAGASAGFSMFPYLTTLTDFASNTAFPVGESLSASSILFGGQVLGFFLSIMNSLFVFDGKSLGKTRFGMSMLIVLLVLGSIFILFSKEKLNRSEYEQCKGQEQSILTTKTHLEI